MKTFFKVSLLSAFFVVNLASASHRDRARADLLSKSTPAEVAMNMEKAITFGAVTGLVAGLAGSTGHALALRNGATAGEAAFWGFAAGGVTGVAMSTARSQIIKDLMGSEYAAAGVLGGVGSCTLTACIYLLTVGTPNAANAGRGGRGGANSGN